MNQDLMKKYIVDYGKDIYSFCVYLTGGKDKADDLYQQTFLTAIEKGNLDETQNPKAYLVTIAVNLWRNQKKKYAVRNKKANIIYLETDNPEQLADGSESVEDLHGGYVACGNIRGITYSHGDGKEQNTSGQIPIERKDEYI